jgi:hypothetical protein
MNNESMLREQARRMIRAGKLPRRSADAMWGGPGENARCGVCGIPVTPAEVEMEIEFARTDGSGSDTYHLHGRCMAAWEAERSDCETNQALAVNANARAAPGSDSSTEVAP